MSQACIVDHAGDRDPSALNPFVEGRSGYMGAEIGRDRRGGHSVLGAQCSG